MGVLGLYDMFIVLKVRQVCNIALRRDHEFINTVQEGSEETHSQVIVYSLVLITILVVWCMCLCTRKHI